jgi:hypothetical protein
MNKIQCLLLASFICSAAHGELVSLGDMSMAEVTGQSGLTIELNLDATIEEVNYSDKDDTSGAILDFKDIILEKINGGTAKSVHQFDVDGTDGLVIKSDWERLRLDIGSISVGDHRGSALDNFNTRPRFGRVRWDFMGTMETKIQGAGNANSGTGGFVVNHQSDIVADLQWFHNNRKLIVDEMSYSIALQDMTIDIEDFSGKTGLAFGMPSLNIDFNLGDVCFRNHWVCLDGDTIGDVDFSMSFKDSYINVFGGGREGVGITMDSMFIIDESQANHFTYTDDSSIHLSNISGYVDTKGFTLDMGTADDQIGDHIAIQVDTVDGLLKTDVIEIGGQSLGSAEVEFHLSDGEHHSITYQNKIKIAPGVAWAQDNFSSHAQLVEAGFDDEMAAFYQGTATNSDGISIYEEWNRVSDIAYTDNGNTIATSNFQAHGSGYTSIEIRQDVADISDSGRSNYLAIGFVDHHSQYSIDGFKVGKSEDNPKDTAALQGGTELLLPLGLYPYYEFNMSGNMEIRTGGAEGSGLNFNGDMYVTDTTFALSTNLLDDGRTVGVWADDVTYDYHYRNYTLDVEGTSVKLIQGEKWSNLNIGNLRWGDKATGDSLGRINMQAYQTQSTVEFIAGGAGGSTCMNGQGASQSACETDGGYWVDKGDEGMTIAIKQNWEQRSADGTKANVFMWENNRQLDTDLNAIDGTGTRLTLDNITTSDGYNPDDNAYGLKITLAIDVANTRVLDREDSTLEKIMTGPSTYEYKSTASLSEADRLNRPLGFSVAAQVQFKELTIDSVTLTHPDLPNAPQTLFTEVKMQNFNLTSNLTATPIQ